MSFRSGPAPPSAPGRETALANRYGNLYAVVARLPAKAHCWEAAGDRLPGEVASLIRSFPRYADDDPELLLAVPERIVPLPGGSQGSHNDVLALIGVGGDLMVAAVEGKVSERFGDDTIEQWFSDPSPGKEKRLRCLCDRWAPRFRRQGTSGTSCSIGPRPR